MATQVEFECEQHADLSACPDSLIAYDPIFNEYALRIHDGGTSGLMINFCPWCGASLPQSLRDRWFDELGSLGFDNPFAQEIPIQFKSDAWYRF
jgi:hypothetical protein